MSELQGKVQNRKNKLEFASIDQIENIEYLTASYKNRKNPAEIEQLPFTSASLLSLREDKMKRLLQDELYKYLRVGAQPTGKNGAGRH